jgi:hypothetical protein
MRRKYLLSLFLLLQIIAIQILAHYPAFVTHFYSEGWFLMVSKFMRTLFGKIPFSVGDCFYILLLIIVLKKSWDARKSWKKEWKSNLLKVASVFSIIYFLFHLLWAMNYYREPLSEKMNIKKDYSTADLLAFTEKLIIKTNAVHLQITKDANQKVINPHTPNEIFSMTQNGYDNLSKIYPFFDYKTPSIKKSIFSFPLTYMGFGGYLNPFTNEAQVNDKLPLYGFPVVVCHEMAHQIGYASESEANFIGFLSASKNYDLYFQYAAYSTALHNCLYNIEMKDKTQINHFKSKINPGIVANYKESKLFWEHYETPIATGFDYFYDHFLKMNQQKEGIESYSKYVDLMVNFYKNKAL